MMQDVIRIVDTKMYSLGSFTESDYFRGYISDVSLRQYFELHGNWWSLFSTLKTSIRHHQIDPGWVLLPLRRHQTVRLHSDNVANFDRDVRSVHIK